MSRNQKLHPRAGVRRAYTLVELLVVLGLITVLLAMLLPVLGRARETAKSITCLSNLRQMAISAQDYAIDSKGYYPIAYYFATQGTETVSYCWDLTTIEDPVLPAQVVPGLLWQSDDPMRIQQCPSFEGNANWLEDPFTGYNYNASYVGHGEFESVPAPVKAASIQFPSQTAMFGDGQWAAGADKFMRAPFPNPGDESFSGRWSGTQGFRHLGRTNVAFCDGHAESLDACCTDNADGSDNVAAGTGFLSSDNHLYSGK